MKKALLPTDSRLRRPCKSVSLRELRTKAIQSEIEQMLDFVYGVSTNKGEKRNDNKATTVGLSANQIGLGRRICVVDMAIGHKDFQDLQVFVNPVITWMSKSLIEKQEGCVNLNNIWGVINRSKRVKVDAYDRSGNKLSLDVNGWPAVLLQHEIDHLNGLLFIDRLEDPSKAHLVKDGQYKEYKKLKNDWPIFKNVSKLVIKPT
jgi:peptide deformylase